MFPAELYIALGVLWDCLVGNNIGGKADLYLANKTVASNLSIVRAYSQSIKDAVGLRFSGGFDEHMLLKLNYELRMRVRAIDPAYERVISQWLEIFWPGKDGYEGIGQPYAQVSVRSPGFSQTGVVMRCYVDHNSYALTCLVKDYRSSDKPEVAFESMEFKHPPSQLAVPFDYQLTRLEIDSGNWRYIELEQRRMIHAFIKALIDAAVDNKNQKRHLESLFVKLSLDPTPPVSNAE